MNKILLNLPNIITTRRLILRHPTKDDGVNIRNMISDGYDEIVKWLSQPKILPDIDYFENEARMAHARWIARSDMKLLIIDQKSNKIVGIGLYPPCQVNWNISCFGIVYVISRSYQNKNYATEAVNAMIRFAFDFMKARTIEIKCDIENKKAIRIPEKLNIDLEFIQKGRAIREDNSLEEANIYSLFNADKLPDLKIDYKF